LPDGGAKSVCSCIQKLIHPLPPDSHWELTFDSSRFIAAWDASGCYFAEAQPEVLITIQTVSRLWLHPQETNYQRTLLELLFAANASIWLYTSSGNMGLKCCIKIQAVGSGLWWILEIFFGMTNVSQYDQNT